MPRCKTLIIGIAVGFGLSLSVVQALAASSQPRGNSPTNTIWVKGGASTKHKVIVREALMNQSIHSQGTNNSPADPGQFAAERMRPGASISTINPLFPPKSGFRNEGCEALISTAAAVWRRPDRCRSRRVRTFWLCSRAPIWYCGR